MWPAKSDFIINEESRFHRGRERQFLPTIVQVFTWVYPGAP